MEKNETFLKIEFLGDESHVEIHGNRYDLATAMANCLLEDDALQVIVLTGLVGACQVRPDLKDKLNKANEKVVVIHEKA